MFHLFPSKFVYWKQIDKHEELKSKYYDKITDHINGNSEVYNEKVKKGWDCECTSSYFDKHAINSLLEADFYKEIVWNPLDSMLLEIGEKTGMPAPQKSTVKEIWYNKYSPGNWQEVHNHLPSTFSGVYLFHLEEKNTTVFVDNVGLNCWGKENNMPLFSTARSGVDIEEGTVIIFPSELMHFVNPCKKEKISISFNIYSQFVKLPLLG